MEANYLQKGRKLLSKSTKIYQNWGFGGAWGGLGANWGQKGAPKGSNGDIFDAKWRPQGPPGLPKWSQNGDKKLSKMYMFFCLFSVVTFDTFWLPKWMTFGDFLTHFQ